MSNVVIFKKKSFSDSLPSKLNLKIQLRIRNWGTQKLTQVNYFYIIEYS